MKIIILSNSYLTAFDQRVLGHILDNAELSIIGMLVNTRNKPGIWQRIKREFRKGRGGYIVVQSFRAVLNKLKKNDACRAVDYAAKLGVRCLETNTLYRQEVYDWIKLEKPDVLFLRGFGIIKDPILSIAPHGVLSYHHANIRKYRGGPPLFWELYNNEKEAGITLQILDEGLDTGTIVLQKFVPIVRESWASLRKKVYQESEPMAAEALLLLKNTAPFRNPVGARGKLFTLPNLQQWLSLQIKIAIRKILK